MPIYAPIAQGIEHRSPEPSARVRIPLGAPFINAGDESIFVYIREKTSVQIGTDVFYIYMPGSSEFRGNNNLLSGIRRIHWRNIRKALLNFK